MLRINLSLPDGKKYCVGIPSDLITVKDLVEYLRKLFKIDNEIGLCDDADFRFLETCRIDELVRDRDLCQVRILSKKRKLDLLDEMEDENSISELNFEKTSTEKKDSDSEDSSNELENMEKESDSED